MAMTEVHLPAEHLDPCAILDWDSAFPGVRVAKVQSDSLTEERVRDIDAWCKGNDIRCLYFLGRPDDPTTTRVAEESHFRLVDIRMTWSTAALACGPWRQKRLPFYNDLSELDQERVVSAIHDFSAQRLVRSA
jgi:hypothetical protein